MPLGRSNESIMNKIILGSVIAGVLAFGGFLAGKDITVQAPEVKLSAVTSNVIPAFDLTVGELRTWQYKRGFTTGTTTVCAIQSPAATSTLVHGGVMLTTASTTASVVTLAKATTAFATTTNLNRQAVSANAQATIMASSSPVLATGAINDLVFAPNTYFVVGMEGGAGTFSPAGSCIAQFVEF
jgi:hypothetical protein